VNAVDDILDIDDIDSRSVELKSQGYIDAERQVKIYLAASAPAPIKLEWNAGGRNGRQTIIELKPGHMIVQPLGKAEAWFGPFSKPKEYAQTSDERKRESLRNLYRTERERYLLRYDWPRMSGRGQQPNMQKGGHHRSPDIIVTIVNADGTEEVPISLHQLYKIGEWDPEKDTFGIVESADDIRAKYEAKIIEERQHHDDQVSALRRELAELAGLVKGQMIAKVQPTAANPEKIPAGKT
jgi:hypothetical protein